jgi:hypothetical protein
VTNAGEGAVYVYWLNGEGKWTPLQKLSSTDHGTYASMGGSVGISDYFVIAGARIEHRDLMGKNELSNAGAVYIFQKPTGLKPLTEIPDTRIKNK